MKKSKIILIAVYVIAVAVVAYFAYGVVKKRYIAPAPPSASSADTSSQAGEEDNGQADSQSADQSANGQENDSSVVDNSAPGEGRPNVQSADCDNDCSQYKDNPDNLKYCQEVCGIRPATPKVNAKASRASTATAVGAILPFRKRTLLFAKRSATPNSKESAKIA
ncbi:MAG: hypothetical protein V1814_02210 [Candidatus Moraniibacteriota bacterium]